jgi:hypothetical protein
MKTSDAASLVLLSALFCVGLAASPPGTSPGDRQSPPAMRPLIAEDQGSFRVLVHGQPAGHEQFEIKRAGGDWEAHSTADAGAIRGAATAHITATLKFSSEGIPLHYEWSVQGAKKASATIEFRDATATIGLHPETGKPFVQQFTFANSRVAILDDNLYHQYEILAWMYDWQKGGTQSFPVLVPQEMIPGTVTVESVPWTPAASARPAPESATNSKSAASVQQLRVHTADIDIYLFLDGAHRLTRISVPASDAEIIRE